MNPYDGARYRLANEHRLSYGEEPGGAYWSCSCGRRSIVSAGYPTHAQAVARGHRHLAAALARIQREIRQALS